MLLTNNEMILLNIIDRMKFLFLQNNKTFHLKNLKRGEHTYAKVGVHKFQLKLIY